MNDKLKEIIDLFSYENMIKLHRFAPSGNRYFLGDTGIYFAKVMSEKKSKLSTEECIKISKKVGWDEG